MGQIMRSSLSFHAMTGFPRLLAPIAASLAALVLALLPGCAEAEDVNAAIHKANLYIEVAKSTERAVDSWDRYRSWVDMNTGPTGKERYISYGLYEVHDVSGLLKEAHGPAGLKPDTPKLDAAVKRYIDAFEAVAPVLNVASAYYDREGYRSDGMAEGKKLHARMMPLATAFLAEREAMLAELRPFVRDVERQEVAALEAREGRSRSWHAANVMHTASRVVDLFPRIRPEPMSSDALDEMMRSLGPDTPGEKFDEMIAGVVKPAGVVIDMKRFDPALKEYAEAVDAFDRFAAGKPDGLKDFKELPRHFLGALRDLYAPLARSAGRDFDGSGPLVGRVVEGYFELLNASNGVSQSQVRFLQ